MAVKITETVSALTQLMDEEPHSSVNFSQHLQPQSALSTNVGGLGRVRAIQAEAGGVDSNSPSHLSTAGCITQLHTA